MMIGPRPAAGQDKVMPGRRGKASASFPDQSRGRRVVLAPSPAPCQKVEGMIRLYFVPAMVAPAISPDWPNTIATTGCCEVIVSAP